jgi:hypothetical protein
MVFNPHSQTGARRARTINTCNGAAWTKVLFQGAPAPPQRVSPRILRCPHTLPTIPAVLQHHTARGRGATPAGRVAAAHDALGPAQAGSAQAGAARRAQSAPAPRGSPRGCRRSTRARGRTPGTKTWRTWCRAARRCYPEGAPRSSRRRPAAGAMAAQAGRRETRRRSSPRGACARPASMVGRRRCRRA